MATAKEVTITNETGLHARPAQKFVETAGKFVSDIKIVKEDGREADAKSILGVMSLGLEKGTTVTLRAEGNDEAEAIQALAELVENQFGETK
jgi:phosphocarrier protein HPr